MHDGQKNQSVIQRLRTRLLSLTPRTERNAVFELLRKDQMQLPPKNPELHIEQVTGQNVTSILNFRDENVLDIFRQYLGARDIGVYAYYNGCAVGHAWAAVWHGSKRFVWGYLPVDPTTACIYFCSVSPTYRGRKIYQNMLVDLARLVFETAPIHRILISCATSNLPSFRAIERVGFRRLLILPILCWHGHTVRLARIPEM